ncbi:MAG: SDR family NAD(P)-dependent oxidoreductase [Alphaproteobacteria bacterium]
MMRPVLSVINQFRLDQDVAVVTGAGNGIGRTAAIAFAEAGAHVAVTDRDRDAAERVSQEISDAGGVAYALELDVSEPQAIEGVVDHIVGELGTIHVLVNNAGISSRRPTEELSLEEWNRVVAINMTGAFVACRAVAPHMFGHGNGRIVNTASVMGLVGGAVFPNLPYHATKGAIVNMTRALAAEWAPRGIRVNAIAPTFTETALVAPLLADEEKVRRINELTPLGRFAQPAEMAGGFLYLASNASAMVTGHILAIDGGWLAV